MLQSSRRIALPALLGALLLIGCGQDTETPEQAAQPPAPQTQELNRPFTVAIPQVGENFDVASVLPAEISAVSYNVFDWLFDRDHKGNVKPGLAKSWEWNGDGTELTLTLRDNVTFHTGEPMTAEDVAFSWSRILKGCCATRITRSLEDIELLDDHTVRLHFSRPDVAFVPVGGFPILSKDYFDEVGERQFKEQPVGTGPYRFADLVRGSYVQLERYDDYWGDQPQVETARFLFVSEDSTRVAQLRAGEADMIMMVPYPLAPQIEKAPNLDVEILSPGGMTMWLALKTDNPDTPWADPRVREAIALAIDHEAIVEDILGGYPTHYPLLAPNDLGYDPELEPYDYDPERARELLKQAGHEDLKIDLPYIAASTTGMKETAEAVALYLNQVGIEARVDPMQGPQFIKWVQQVSGDPERDYIAVFVGGIAGRSEPSSTLIAQFSQVVPFAWYVNPEINKLVLEAGTITDREKRAQAIRKIGKLVHGDMRYIPLWTSSHIYGMKACIDFTPTLGEYDLMMLRDVNIADCKQPQ